MGKIKELFSNIELVHIQFLYTLIGSIVLFFGVLFADITIVILGTTSLIVVLMILILQNQDKMRHELKIIYEQIKSNQSHNM